MSDIFRNLLSSGLTSIDYLTRNDASRNAIFGYSLGRLLVTNAIGNSITADLLHPQGFTAIQDGTILWFIPTASNTGPTEINIGGIGPIPIRNIDGVVLSGGELTVGLAAILGYSSATSSFRILSSTSASSGNNLLGIQLKTVTGTYVPTSGTNMIFVIGQAPGGGGGAANSSIVSKLNSGGAGETRFGVFPVTGSLSATIGAFGVGGLTGTAAGTTAGDIVLGTLMTCKGGTGGISFGGGGIGITPTGSGGIRIPPAQEPTGATASSSGNGGSSLLGHGGLQPITTDDGSGGKGSGYGGGGAGGVSTGAVQVTGGNGAPGAFIILEFGSA